MAVLQHQLMVGARPSLFVKRAFSQDEMVIVQMELRGVVKQYLADLAVEGVAVDIDLQAQALDGFGSRLPELKEAVLAGETIGLQQDLVFAIVDDIAGQVPRFGVLADVLVHGMNCSTFLPAGQKTSPCTGADKQGSRNCAMPRCAPAGGAGRRRYFMMRARLPGLVIEAASLYSPGTSSSMVGSVSVPAVIWPFCQSNWADDAMPSSMLRVSS